jgi:hypothetical protein
MSRTKTFAFPLSHEPAAVIEKARKAAAGNGVRFEGDEQQGRFAGHGVEGSYAIKEAQLTIQIVRKPIIMPWSMIESSMRKFFA